MVWNICLILGIAILLSGIAFFAYMRKKGKRNFLYLGASVFAAAVILCFPVKLLEDSWGYALCMSISHSIRMFVVDTGISDITGFLTQELLGKGFHIYKGLVCVLYICAPMFTVGLILQYFSHFFENLRLLMRKKRDLFVFSELNEQSYLAAKNLWEKAKNKNDIALVFCQTEEKDMLNQVLEDRARELQAVFMAKEMEQLKLDDKKRHISYFEISENEELNLEHSIQMIENLKGHATSNSALYCYASGPEAEILIDSKEKGKLRVILVDEVRDAVYEHLYEYPLFCNLLPPEQAEKRQKFGILIMGGGKTGCEFLKAAAWCGQLKGFDLEIHLLDQNGMQIQDRLKNDYPELLGEKSPYNIQIHEVDVFGKQAELLLDSLDGINYCVAALGNDEDNIKISLYLRRYYYRRNTGVQPVVCAHIRGEKKRQAVMEMYETTRIKGGRISYEILPFGNSGKMFREETDAPFVAEYLSLGVHFYYFRLGKDATDEERQSALQSYYAKQGNRRSSVANGLHISYKLWELGMAVARVPENPAQKALFDQYIKPVNFLEETKGKLQEYYDLEHDRWMAFTRTEGWRLATYNSGDFEDVKACYESYCDIFKNQNHLAKMHPALVPLEASYPGEAILIDVENMMGEVNDRRDIGKYHPDYVNSDVELINHIGEIVAGEWCGEQGIMIQGRHIRPHQCVICKREDFQKYKELVKQEA